MFSLSCLLQCYLLFDCAECCIRPTNWSIYCYISIAVGQFDSNGGALIFSHEMIGLNLDRMTNCPG